ncbi:unnamed protein product [Vitrella brassicaformis CCMP3155]|uniref:Uncharacterized protein n=1 Tax=Vitrella brassicaformis (strain CCMP3155) TaxID=1169540 RepID=A0A0G4EZS6_VITBC|nr:unnamed protein product [Vitrella brassicaformis CCMP3155]|eukprot:CEM04333.1 unnamed protein product [Vitrella brassicaformis CCMP3155]
MASSLPDDLWLGRILPSLLVHEAVCVRATCRAKAALVTAALLVERIDGSLARHSLTGLIDIDRTAPLPFSYSLRAAYVLEQGSNEWPGMGRFIRLAAIYRLTPANGLPLVLSGSVADSPPSQQDGIPPAAIGDGHLSAAEGYQRTDPVIRWIWLFRSFSAFLLATLLSQWRDGEGVGYRLVLSAHIGSDDPRCDRLLTDDITEDRGIAVDYRYDRGNLNDANAIDYRHVIVSGFRRIETVAVSLCVWSGGIKLFTTERPAANTPASVAVRFPTSEPLWRRLLRPFNLETDVIDRGAVVG